VEIIGLAVGFGATVIAISGFLAPSHWWHRHFHQDGQRVMCDHCYPMHRDW
jgi:hypothetical protein